MIALLLALTAEAKTPDEILDEARSVQQVDNSIQSLRRRLISG